jgi:hypothetical protein
MAGLLKKEAVSGKPLLARFSRLVPGVIHKVAHMELG